ncbi:MAG TPA: PP2C family protein-serine/threonine phosphatase [Solirubrobacteraceae bacterium]|nr:PP2C family protein-serine/threonine phosphatase [Solirubrobacteraceae bacterium]
MSLTGGDANRRARRARRGLAVAIVGCGVFALQSLPAASAAKGGATSTVTSAGEGSAAATRRAERAAAKAEGAPPPQSPAPPAVEAPAPAGAPPHGHHGQPGLPPPPPPVGLGAGAGAAPHKGGAAAAAHAQRREERREERRSNGSTSTSTSTSGAGAKPAVTTAGGEPSANQAEAFARKQKKGGGGGKGKKEHKGKKAPQEEGSGSEGSGSEGASSPGAKPKGEPAAADAAAQATAAAASFALPEAAPAAGTAPASVSAVTPVVKAAPGGGVNADKAKRRAARRARKRSSATGPAATAAASPLLTTQSGAAAPATHAKRTAAKRSQRQSSQPALVKTFTKIVGVVPTPVRILIGGLILLAVMLGVRSLLSGVRTRRLVRQRGQLLEDVGLLQAALLPEPPARLGPVATSVAYRPADGPGAGGDFYDVFALEGGEIAVIVGDVSGHGREALPHTALLRFTVRAYLEAGLSPRKALQTAGNVLDRQLAGSFATVIAATYNPRERKLTYASAGHPPPVMLGEQRGGAEAPAEGERRARALAPVTTCSAPPIGAGMPTGTRQTVVSVAGPTRLCFHTDGVTEARVDEQLFGAERLTAALSDLDHDADASELLDRVTELSDARPDDMAACLLRVHDGQGPPAIVLAQLELSRELLAGGRVERFLLDCGVEAGEAESIVQDARRRLQRADCVMLELVPDADRSPIVSLIDDNVIRAAALATSPDSSRAVMTR